MGFNSIFSSPKNAPSDSVDGSLICPPESVPFDDFESYELTEDDFSATFATRYCMLSLECSTFLNFIHDR